MELWDPTTTTFSCTATGRGLRRAVRRRGCADVTLCVCVCVFQYCYMERAMWYACFLFARTSPRIGSLRPGHNNRTLIYAPFFVSRDRKGYPGGSPSRPAGYT